MMRTPLNIPAADVPRQPRQAELGRTVEKKKLAKFEYIVIKIQQPENLFSILDWKIYFQNLQMVLQIKWFKTVNFNHTGILHEAL